MNYYIFKVTTVPQVDAEGEHTGEEEVPRYDLVRRMSENSMRLAQTHLEDFEDGRYVILADTVGVLNVTKEAVTKTKITPETPRTRTRKPKTEQAPEPKKGKK